MEEITFNFRSIGCGGTPAPGNRVFDVRGTTNSESELYLRAWRYRETSILRR